MTYQPKLSVGAFFSEVDDTGQVHHYWILATAKSFRTDDAQGEEVLRQIESIGNLATTVATSDSSKRITWDISPTVATNGMPAIG